MLKENIKTLMKENSLKEVKYSEEPPQKQKILFFEGG